MNTTPQTTPPAQGSHMLGNELHGILDALGVVGLVVLIVVLVALLCWFVVNLTRDL